MIYGHIATKYTKISTTSHVGLKYAAFTFASITTAIIFSHPWRRAKLVQIIG